MADRPRIKTKRQGDQEMVAQQDGFLGGMNLDSPPSEIDGTEMAELYNYQPFRTHLRSRPGAIDLGALPSTGDVDDTPHQMFWHHVVSKAVLHRGTKLFVGSVVAPDQNHPWGQVTWAEVANSVIQPTPTTMAALGKDVVIFNPQEPLRLEWNRDLDGGYSFRKLTGAHPVTEASVGIIYRGPTDDNHLYRFLYTLARIVDGEVIAESGTPTAQGDDTDYVEYGMAEAYGTGDAFVEISPYFENPDPDFWTHAILYRTKDIQATALNEDGTTNDPQRYYRMGEVDITTANLGIGDMTIGTTFIVSTESNNKPDNALTEYLKSRLMVPMPAGRVGAVAPGLLFMAVEGDTKVSFCGLQEGRSRFAGIYRPDIQYLEVEGGVWALETTPDTLVILTSAGTYRITTYSTQNGGNEEFGEYIPYFQGQVITTADSEIGVKDWSSISRSANGKILSRCTDNTIRAFDGLQWTTDYSRNKIQRVIRTIGPNNLSNSYYDPRGAYILWYFDNQAVTRCIRLGMSEDQGIGWSWYDGAGWPSPYAGVKVVAAPAVNGQLVGLATDYTTDHLYAIEYEGIGTDRPDDDHGTDFTCSGLGREIRGTSERHWVRHQQSYVFLRPIPGYPQAGLSDLVVEVSAYLDGATTASATAHDVPHDDRVVFSEELGGRRLQMGWTATGVAHCVPCIETLFQSQDRATLWTPDTLRSVQEDLATGMVFWSNREDPLRNSCAWDGLEEGTWQGVTGTTTTGPDGFANSSLSLNP